MYKNIITKVSSVTALFFLPFVVSAATQSGNNLGNIKNLIQSVGDIISLVLPIVIGLGVVLFIWGLVKRLFSDEEDARKAGWKYMGFGILIIFVAVSLVGLVEFVGRALNIDQGGRLETPCVEGLDC